SVYMSPLGFTKVNEGHAYRCAGSFTGFVVLEHGMPAFLELQRTLDWEAATGRTLDELDADWRAFLATLPVDPLEQARARDRFDPAAAPGVYDRRCPKLGSRVPAPETVARARLDHGDPLGAAELYATLPGDRWTQAAASALQRAGRHEEALAALATVATPSPDREQQVLQARINSLLALAVEDPGRWPDLYAAFARRRELEPPPQERQDIERLLAGPMREALGAALLASGEPGSLDVAADRFRALVEAWPDEPALLRLRARRGTVLPSRVWRRATLADRVRWREAVEVWEASGECPEPVDLERTVVAFLEEGDCALAERWQVLVGGACASDWRSGAVDARMAAARGSGVCH
ncbi:MAG: hypothetical protein KC656_32735, partial [Myxococcales bacterium]|nr:hypothetical protein [Myxococcales bacterium]